MMFSPTVNWLTVTMVLFLNLCSIFFIRELVLLNFGLSNHVQIIFFFLMYFSMSFLPKWRSHQNVQIDLTTGKIVSIVQELQLMCPHTKVSLVFPRINLAHQRWTFFSWWDCYCFTFCFWSMSGSQWTLTLFCTWLPVYDFP